jgi:hypothetical protein
MAAQLGGRSLMDHVTVVDDVGAVGEAQRRRDIPLDDDDGLPDSRRLTAKFGYSDSRACHVLGPSLAPPSLAPLLVPPCAGATMTPSSA